MKTKLILLCLALFCGLGGVKAALSSSTITKSSVVTDTWNISSALPTDNWTAMGEGTPQGVKDLGSYTAYSRTQDITISADGALFITFEYSSGNHQLEPLGVELLNSSNVVVRSDYHYGKTGTYKANNVYMLDQIASGAYKIRFIINSNVSSSVGNITVKHLNIKTASSYADISHWYFVRMNTNATNYMYYNSGASANIAFGGTKANEDKYLWGFVKDTDGVKIYNKAAGSTVAIDNANPCTLSASGQTFTFANGTTGDYGAAADAYFALYKNTASKNEAKSYLNYNAAGIKRHTDADAGSTFMIDEAVIAGGRIYTIKAHFPNYDDLYFTNSDGTTLTFNTAASNGVKDYWILRSSSDGTYPWIFESGRGDGKFLSNNSKTEGLTNSGVYLQINSVDTYFNLRGSKDGDAKTTGIVNLGTWTSGKSGFGAYGEGGCWSSSGNSKDNDTWTTKYIIEEVADVDIYTVVSNINDGGVNKSTYTGKADQTNGGFYILASAPSASDFTALTVSNYTAGDVVVDASAKTITVNYTATITYTLTDVNGQEYEWSASGTFGTAPTLTGCVGYTLSNEVWNEGSRTYTADITFPFPVSSNSKTNWTYINIFDAKPNYKISDGSRFYWHANGANVIVHNLDEPTNETGKIDEYKWAIIPSITNGAITFTIKNAVSNKYIYHDSSESYNSHTGIKLGDTSVSLTYVKDGSAAKYYWYMPTESKYLSANSVDGGTNQRLGAYATTHDGESVGFYTPADFTTLLANLKTAYNTFGTFFTAYSPYLNDGTYAETVANAMASAYGNNSTVRDVVKDGPTRYLTATQFKTYTDAYNNAMDGLYYVMPTGKFIRIKNADGSKYAKASPINYSTEVQLAFSAGGTDATSLFYMDASNKMIAYYSGSYLFATNNTGRIANNSWVNAYEFLKGSTAGKVYIHASNDPTGWGVDRYWTVSNDGTKIDRVSAESDADDFVIEEVTSLPITMHEVSGANYATIKLPVAVEIPSGLSAYSATASGDVLTLTKVVENDVLAANIPVILYSESNVTSLTISNETGESPAGTNELNGTIAAASVTANANYVLGNGDNGVGFYKYNNTVMPGFKAYLPASTTSSNPVKGFIFSFEDAEDAIRAIESENSGLEIYDISGRRVQKAQKGLYIVNGKKVMYK